MESQKTLTGTHVQHIYEWFLTTDYKDISINPAKVYKIAIVPHPWV